MNKYELYTLDQLLEIVRNGRADVSKKAADEIRERFKSHRKKGAADGARFCPACHALLEEHSVYCDTCGTDTPRR